MRVIGVVRMQVNRRHDRHERPEQDHLVGEIVQPLSSNAIFRRNLQVKFSDFANNIFADKKPNFTSSRSVDAFAGGTAWADESLSEYNTVVNDVVD